MNKRAMAGRGLVGLNLVLLAALAWVVVGRGGPSAVAQSGGAGGGGLPPGVVNRPRGDYVMVSGKMQGAPSHAVFVIDTANQELIAIKWDRAADQLVGIGYRNMAADAGLRSAQPGGGGR
jgi:hypothetical protein